MTMKRLLNTHLIIQLTVTSSTNPMFVINYYLSIQVFLLIMCRPEMTKMQDSEHFRLKATNTMGKHVCVTLLHASLSKMTTTKQQ